MRLTKKDLDMLDTTSAYSKAQHKAVCEQAIKECYEYKCIEEEFGIDLILVGNTLKNGFYYRNPYFDDEVEFFPDSFKHFSGIMRNENGLAMAFGKYGVVYFEDYGTGWALTKEELS